MIHTKFEKQIRIGITSLIFIMIIPSFYLAYRLFQEKNFNHKVDQFITNEFTNKGFALIYKNIQYNYNPKKIEFAFLTKKFTDQEIELIKEKMPLYDLQEAELVIRQETNDIKGEILDELGKQNKILTDKDIIINNLQNELNTYKFDNKALIDEIQILFPEIKDLSIGKHITTINDDSTIINTVLLYELAQKNAILDKQKLEKWLTQKLNTEHIIIIKN